MTYCKKIFKFFKNNSTIILGLFIFSIYIFFRFIKERLPKDIPFTLSILGFFILIELCCIYAYIVWSYIRPPKYPNEVIIIIKDFIFKPLEDFDSFIKDLSYIKLYYPKILMWLIYKFEYIFKTSIFDIILFFIPRIILIIVFTMDIFYFHKLYYIYYVLLLGILLLIRRYIKYSIKAYKKNLEKEFNIYAAHIGTHYEFGVDPSEWPENYDPDDPDNDEIPPTMGLDLDIFIEYYIRKKLEYNIDIKVLWIVPTTIFFRKYKNSFTMISNKMITHYDSEDYKNEQRHETLLEKQLQDILQLNLVLTYYNIQEVNNVILKNIKIIIFTIYLICWICILLSSIHTLNIFNLLWVINLTWMELLDPFCSNQLFLEENNEILIQLFKELTKF